MAVKPTLSQVQIGRLSVRGPAGIKRGALNRSITSAIGESLRGSGIPIAQVEISRAIATAVRRAVGRSRR